nr:uncharacterized protein LOC115256180 [Aedes albopictus]
MSLIVIATTTTTTTNAKHRRHIPCITPSNFPLISLYSADTPSITKVRPLISPTGLQITTRGRVVFNIVPVSQPLTEVVAAAMSTGSAAAVAAGENHPVLMPPSYVNLKSYLSPEYVNCLGKKPNFSESDVEKMWIYSLGVTLQKTISSFSVNYHQHQQKQHQQQQQQQLRNDADGRRSAAGTVTPTDEDGLTALDHVILAMCEANLYKRASLMFLLDMWIYSLGCNAAENYFIIFGQLSSASAEAAPAAATTATTKRCRWTT